MSPDANQGTRSLGGWVEVLGAAASIVTIVALFDAAVQKLSEWMPFAKPYLPLVLSAGVATLGVWFFVAVRRKVIERRRRLKSIARQEKAKARETHRRAQIRESRDKEVQRQRLLKSATWLYTWYGAPYGDRVQEHNAELIYNELVEAGLLDRTTTVNLTPFQMVDHLARVVAVLQRSLDDAIRILRAE